MNEIVNKFLLAGDKFMREMHLRQPGFTYSACGPFTKNKEQIQKLKKQEIQAIFTKTNLIRLVFSMIYGDVKDIKRRTASDRILRDKAFNIAKNPKYDGYQRGLAFMVYKFFDKKSTGSDHPSSSALLIVNNNDAKQNSQLAEELHKSIIKKF